MITKICSIFKKVLIFLHKLSIYEKKYEAINCDQDIEPDCPDIELFLYQTALIRQPPAPFRKENTKHFIIKFNIFSLQIIGTSFKLLSKNILQERQNLPKFSLSNASIKPTHHCTFVLFSFWQKEKINRSKSFCH